MNVLRFGRKTLAVLLLLTVILSFSATLQAKAFWYSPPPLTGSTYIVDAYYCDSDWDDHEDDVETYVYFEFSGGVPGDAINFVFYTVMTLPSGQQYIYRIDVTTYDRALLFHLIYYNHATEPGWYAYEIHLFLQSGEYIAYTYDAVLFDPPGPKIPDSPPDFGVANS